MTTTRKKTLLHCGILTGILGAVVLLIFLVHPGCVYGAQTDWSNQPVSYTHLRAHET